MDIANLTSASPKKDGDLVDEKDLRIGTAMNCDFMT